MDQQIKWGIIGIGKIAEKFAYDLSFAANCKLEAVASNSLERAQDFAIRHKADHAYGCYEDLFKSEVDVVYIATPHTLHESCTQLCLEHGVAVLCEKPFAMNEKEVTNMVNLAREKKIFLMEAMWTRFLPSTLKMMELLAADTIGKIKTIHADFGFVAPFLPERRTLNPKLGGGAFLDIGIYPAFLSLLTLGYPSKIEALSIFGPTGVDETTSFIYQYDNEATAVLNCSFGAETNTEAFIYGTEGSIHLHSRFHESKKLTLNITGQEPQDFSFERETFGYNYEIEEVNKCLRNGQMESELMPLAMSLKLIHLLDKTREAARIVY
ncbi:Gfo/Idh/MocA family oxidoreductase [Emticicia sp. CRIBPO]|uniref:Gfo/Idh/MocA family protein n=1 Tax=Emticicia sp. CRIBPO TaxID=2683258 RepID=UPI00141205E6|nr:Gfo/Idh/MocA family oxidoreductase [Emticicia sp. CRIBPO]NBA86771.1 Gfo/Idh/MocA family oxidoreductase [Emticicia sp. CRIBPO]